MTARCWPSWASAASRRPRRLRALAAAAELARARTIRGARRIEAYDGEHVPAADGAYDLAVLSHVLEHVDDPARLLREAARVAPAVLVEVPLEANRSAGRPAKRAEAARIGHIQFLDRAAVHELVTAAGLAVAAELSDPLPYAHHAFFASSRRPGRAPRSRPARGGPLGGLEAGGRAALHRPLRLPRAAALACLA